MYSPRRLFELLDMKHLPRDKCWHRTDLTDFFTCSYADLPSVLKPPMLPTLSENNRICSPSERCDWLLLQLAKLVKAVWLLKHCVDKAVMLTFLVLLHRARKAAWGKATVQYLVLPCRAGEGSEGCNLTHRCSTN